MRHILLLIGFVLLTTSSNAQTCTISGTLQDGLVGYWPFCGNANDESGNGNDGVVNGPVLAEDRFGNATGAYVFDGVDDFIEVNNSQSLENISSLTIQAWYKVNSWFPADNFNWFPIICKSVDANPGQYSLSCRSDGYVHNASSNLASIANSNDINAWVHCAVVTSQDTTRFYENGLLVGEVTSFNTLSNISASANLLFGKDSPGIAEFANGIIDDIAIWNRALTQEEIALLFGDFGTPIAGCTDPSACNFNADATINDPTQCCFNNCVTLTMNDAFGDGWNGATATIMDAVGNFVGSVSLNEGSSGTAAFCLADGCYTIIVGGGPFDLEISWSLDGVTGGVIEGAANDPMGVGFSTADVSCVFGCIDPAACNYNSLATAIDGSCIYNGNPCDDGDLLTENDIIIDCFCNGTPVELGTPHTCGADLVHNPNLTYGSMTDQEGNVYKTIVIGEQEWMAENLNTSIYRNGDAIVTGMTNEEWSTTGIGAWAFQNDNSAISCPYGKLYNWFACMDSRNVCPTGWHVPSDGEWATMIEFLGGEWEAGWAMKSTGSLFNGTGLWSSWNEEATNSSGFSAIPGGVRSYSGIYNWYGQTGYWWSATESGPDNAWVRFLNINMSNSGNDPAGNKKDGFSVRCLRDSDTGLVPGCTDTFACNYNMDATEEDGSCTFAGDTCDDGNAATSNDILHADCNCTGAAVNCAALEGTLQNGLVGYWPFCGNANDESGNGNNGVHYLFDGISFYPNPDISSSYGTDRFGNLQAALSTNVYAANVMIPVTNEIFQGDFSINVWAKNDSILSQYPRILGSENHHLNMQYGNTGGPVSFGAYMTEEGIPPFAGVGEVINPYEWVNITLVNEDYINRLYFNGILVDEASDFNVNQAQSLWNLIRIGNGTELPQTAFYGLVDDLVIYSRALTMAEITSLFTGEPVAQPACAQLDPTLQDGLVGYWPFCGNANDESGNGADGNFSDDPIYQATLINDRFNNNESAYNFDGNDVMVVFPNFLNGQDFTISEWFNASESNSLNELSTILSFFNTSGTNEYNVSLEIANTDGLSNQLRFSLGENSTGFSTLVTPFEIGFNQWYHSVIMRVGNQQRLYLNGALIATLENVTTNSFNTIFQVGSMGGDTNSFIGVIDDIGIWNRALTAEEIALLYGNFTPQVTGCTDPIATNYNPLATVNEGCEYTSTVFVYNDLNGSGMHEADEPGLGNWPVLVSNLNILLWTNANGYVYLPLPSSVQELEVLNPTDNWVITTASTATVDFATGVSTASFGLQVIPGEAIIAAGPYQGFWEILHCTDGYESGIYIENIGSQTVSGFLTLDCDPLFTPDADSYFTTPPTVTGPGYAQWSIEDFLPGEFELLSFHIDGPGVDYIGQFFNFEFNLNLFDPQGNMILSETWNVAPEVACAYDPNDITGFPEGLSGENNEGYQDPRFILEGHEVTFVVRFQNTGNYPAEDVRIDIPLDPEKWDIGSFTPFHSSALDMGCLHDDGTYDLEFDSNYVVVKFVLEDIYLPDSVSNEEGSHGFVSFRVNARQDLNPGTELYAQAYIYFDANPAVITNETTHTIFSCDSFSPMEGLSIYCENDIMSFTATQPYVDSYMWALNNTDVGTGEQFSYPATLGNSDDGSVEYVLELITSNALCPLDMYDTEAEVHQVFGVINPTPSLNQNTYDTFCAGDEVAFNAQSNGTVYWSNGVANGSNITATESFVADVYALSNAGCRSATLSWEVTVNPLPSTEVDTNNNVLTAVDGIAWQWSVNGAEDVTTQSITASVSGNYQVEITNEFGCAATSELFVITDVSFVHSWPNLTAYPNPMKDLTRIELPEGTFDVALYDITGARVRMMQQQQGITTIERESLASGVYQVRIHNASIQFVLTLVIE